MSTWTASPAAPASVPQGQRSATPKGVLEPPRFRGGVLGHPGVRRGVALPLLARAVRHAVRGSLARLFVVFLRRCAVAAESRCRLASRPHRHARGAAISRSYGAFAERGAIRPQRSVQPEHALPDPLLGPRESRQPQPPRRASTPRSPRLGRGGCERQRPLRFLRQQRRGDLVRGCGCVPVGLRTSSSVTITSAASGDAGSGRSASCDPPCMEFRRADFVPGFASPEGSKGCVPAWRWQTNVD